MQHNSADQLDVKMTHLCDALRSLPHDSKSFRQDIIFGGALHDPEAATVVRMGDGDLVMTDGPFVEAKEHIAGFYILNADDLDAALAWARKVVDAINHPIEIRPFRATGRVQA